MLSVRFEVGVSLLLAPVGADKSGPKAPFLLVEDAGTQLVIRKRVPAGALVGARSYWKHSCLPGDTWQATSMLSHRKPATHFGAKLEAWKQKNVSYFLLYTVWYDMWDCNSLLVKANTISSEKSCLISMPSLLTCIDVRAVKFFLPAEFWLVIQISRAPDVCKVVRRLCLIMLIHVFPLNLYFSLLNVSCEVILDEINHCRQKGFFNSHTCT